MSGSALRAVQRHVKRALGVNGRIIAGQPMPETHPEVRILDNYIIFPPLLILHVSTSILNL